ncbi:hypothetical protein AALA44_01010 [Enterococcus ratti]|uniref:hypothetical protein n=1 Tax=Enterococcus ratti TaxID=150033 RepID=UPI003518D6F1
MPNKQELYSFTKNEKEGPMKNCSKQSFSPAEKQAFVENYLSHSSKCTQREFAQKNKLKVSTLNRWIKEYISKSKVQKISSHLFTAGKNIKESPIHQTVTTPLQLIHEKPVRSTFYDNHQKNELPKKKNKIESFNRSESKTLFQELDEFLNKIDVSKIQEPVTFETFTDEANESFQELEKWIISEIDASKIQEPVTFETFTDEANESFQELAFADLLNWVTEEEKDKQQNVNFMLNESEEQTGQTKKEEQLNLLKGIDCRAMIDHANDLMDNQTNSFNQVIKNAQIKSTELKPLKHVVSKHYCREGY